MAGLVDDLLQRRGAILVLIVAAFLLPMAVLDAVAGQSPNRIALVTVSRPPQPVTAGDRILRAGDLRPAAALPQRLTVPPADPPSTTPRDVP